MMNDAEVRAAGKAGWIQCSGTELLVRFAYHTERFNFIRRLSGARFDKEARVWRLPLLSLPQLESSALFSAEALHYEFDPVAVQGLVSAEEQKRLQAVARAAANPFFVTAEDLVSAEVDAVFRLASNRLGVRAVPRFRSKVKAQIKAVPGVHYLKTEKAFYFPTQQLHGFLRLLQQENFSFAVEAEAGRVLARDAALRQKILKGDYRPSGAELERCQ